MWAWTFNPVNADLPRLFAFQSEAHRLQCIAAPPWKPPTQGLHHHAVAEGEVVFSLSLLTFNVLTLLDRRPAGERPPLPGVDSVSDGNVGMRLQGRKDALTTMLHEHGPNIVGLQETRLPDTAIQPDSEYHIYTSQANARGGGGCALWLSKTRPYASRGATKLFFRPEHVTVLTCSPRHLTASVLTPELRIFVQVAHASSAFNATPAELKAFWRQREEELARRPEGSYPILLTDANARLGSTVSDNVGDHHAEEALAEAWSTAGQTLQDKSRTAPVRPYVTSLAMQIISFRKELQSYLRQEATERTRRLLQIVFVAFRLYYQHRYFEGDQRALADRWLTAIDYSEALALALYRWYGLRLREQIAAGKRTYFQSLVADASNHTLRRPKELYAAIRKAFPAAKAARRSSLMPLPMLLDAQGQPIATTEARQECWREHFSEQEAGVPVTDQQFVTHLRARHRPAQAVFSIDVLPTLAQTEQVILGLKNGKAAGADCLTAELLKLSVPDTARRLMPVMLKSVLALREPVAWRGGDLILLAKKAGKALDCTGFRSILIASVAGKTFHRCVRTQLVPLLQAAKPALMAGAVEGVGIEVPALAVKTFQLWQQHTRRPWAVIFVDLQSAYYRVLRQLIVRHNGTDEELLSLLRKLDLPDAAIQELRHKLSTLAELPNLRASDHLQAVVADLLTGTWFRLNGQALLTATARGTRPGDPLADVLFSLTLSAYLRAVAHQLKEQGLDPALDTPRSRPHWAQCTDTLDIGAPAWADDFALPQVGDDAAHLLERVVSSVRVLVTHARSLGMVLKFGVEKTAALVSSIVSRTDQACILAGKDGGYHVVVHDDIDGTAYELPILEAYKHLGGIVTSNCSPTPDLHFRFSRASGTVKPLSRKLFSAHSFDLSVRRTLLRALVMSRYMHTGAALILPSAIHQRLWDRHYIALWRHLCRRESASRQEHPYLVLKAAKASAPPLAIAKSRACFLQKLFQHGPGLLLTLLFDHWASHPGSSWLQQFVTDVETVQQYCPTVLHFFRKGAEVHDLLEIYAESANWWPRQVAKAENAFQSDLAKWHAADPTTGLQEDDITIKDLARLFRPDPTDVAWISGHVADASTEGTGKTLLAKAVAGEAGVPFFSRSTAPYGSFHEIKRMLVS
ncbi:unnamed protein product [Symbiodinium microadriaticum]|nr:unnamed protein product [Symbiodinium microadriaticum]